MTARSIASLLTVLASVLLGVGSNAHAQDLWRISKSSGDVSIMTEGFQPIALTAGMSLQPGSSIRTGQNGRVLLMRGNETILVSANSRSEEHTSELQSLAYLVCRLLLETKMTTDLT